jgi:cytochrome c-type biogenesis protein CcmH
MIHYFWFAAGVMTGVAAAFVLTPLSRILAVTVHSRARRYAVGALSVAVFALTALLIYRTLGTPSAVDARTASAPLAHPGAVSMTPGEPGDSVDNAMTRLETRIARDGGSRSDWLLLAQSYDFVGRPEDAARARANAQTAPDSSPAAPLPAATNIGNDTAQFEARVAAEPNDAPAWLALTQRYRQQREFARAREAFARLIALDAMTADAWADYADVLGSLAGGSLAGESAHAIDRALALEPRHTKALWLKASLAHEQHRYDDSLALWKQIRALLPADSADARLIDDNIAEAAKLASSAVDAGSRTASQKVLMVAGTVSIDRKLAPRVPSGATLFIYAKAVDSPGPPLAVLRTKAASWPVSFQLDDTLAMLPERKLSAFEQVIVEARISRTGNAAPAPGDLIAVSPVLRPADAKPLKLVISKEIG